MLSVLAAVIALSGCTRAAPAMSSSGAAITAEGYTAEQIYGYFAEVAFASEYGGYRGRICKWTEKIRCYVSGDFSQEEMAVLTDLFVRLNEIPGFPGVSMTEDREAANFTVAFVMPGELVELFGQEAEHCSGMSRFYFTKNGGEIVQAEAGIVWDITPMNARASVICEEFLQALGLCCDSYEFPESVFYEGYNGAMCPAEIDWALVEVLYSDGIRPGMEAEEALEVVRGLLGYHPEE